MLPQARGVAPTTDTFNTLMAAAVAAGRPQLAVELHGRMDATGLRPDALTYTTLLQVCMRCAGRGGLLCGRATCLPW